MIQWADDSLFDTLWHINLNVISCGIFIEELKNVLSEKGLNIPMIGIQVYNINETLHQLDELINATEPKSQNEEENRYGFSNVYSKLLSGKLLIAGACLLDEWPELVAKVGEGRTILTVCLECVHLNTVIEKIASILAKGSITEIAVITQDGSPHCIGLHYAVEWALKMTKSDDTHVDYYVVEHGVLHHVPEERVKEKRHLSR